MASNIVASPKGLDTVRQMLLENKKKIISMLGDSAITSEYFCAAVINNIMNNPTLLACSKQSILTVLLQAARLRLIPDGLLGHAYIVAYSGEATLIPGYKGIRELVLRTNQYKDIRARVVRGGDRFSYQYGMVETLEHVPNTGTRGEMLAVYAVAERMDGAGAIIEVMSKVEMEEHRKQYSKGSDKKTSAWQTATARMWEKTVMLRLCRRMSMSVETQTVFETQEKVEAGIDLKTGDVVDVTVEKKDEDSNGKVGKITENLKQRNKDNKADGKSTTTAKPAAATPQPDRGNNQNHRAASQVGMGGDHQASDDPNLDIPVEFDFTPEQNDSTNDDLGSEQADQCEQGQANDPINESQVARFLQKANREKIPQKLQAEYLQKKGFRGVKEITRGKFPDLLFGLEFINEAHSNKGIQ